MQVEAQQNEKEQILQTIEMFEVIAQTNPEDYQSLDVLLDAYEKLGRTEDVVRVGCMIGQAYQSSGQYSRALSEIDSLLSRYPDQAPLQEMRSSIAELYEQEGEFDQATGEPMTISLDQEMEMENISASLIETAETDGADSREAAIDFEDDGNDAFARFLVGHDLAGANQAQSAIDNLRAANSERASNQIAIPLLAELLQQEDEGTREEFYSNLLDKLKFPYIPLEFYDVDRQTVRMLPECVTLGRLIVPFDILSRTMMIAIANPLDSAGKEYVQRTLDYTIQWYFARPEALLEILTNVYRLNRED